MSRKRRRRYKKRESGQVTEPAYDLAPEETFEDKYMSYEDLEAAYEEREALWGLRGVLFSVIASLVLGGFAALFWESDPSIESFLYETGAASMSVSFLGFLFYDCSVFAQGMCAGGIVFIGIIFLIIGIFFG